MTGRSRLPVPAGFPGTVPSDTFLVVRRPISACALLLLLALFGSGWLGSANAQAQGGEVTVRAAGDSPESVTVKLSELGDPDVNNRSYRLRSENRSITGYSIGTVLDEAAARSRAIDRDRIPYVEVDRVAAGSTIRLSDRQIDDPGAFADGPPVFFEQDGATVFVKPGTGSGPGSTVRFTNAAIGVTIGVDDDLSVSLRASPETVESGDDVTLRAKVKDPPAGQSLEYRWTFGDGRSRTTSKSSVTHTYAKKGNFLVVVTVTTDGGASGQGSGALEVGNSEKQQNSENDTGGDGTGGGGSGGTGTGSGDPYGGSGLGADYGIPGDYGYDYGATPPGAPAYPSAPPPGSNAAPNTDPRPAAPVDDGLVPIAGDLVSGTAPAPVASIPPPSGGAQSVEPADPAGIPGAVWMIGGALFLVALGGLSENRAFSRFWD